MVTTVTNLQCVCKRIIKDKARPDLVATNCKCSGFDQKGVEITFKVKGFVQVIKR